LSVLLTAWFSKPILFLHSAFSTYPTHSPLGALPHYASKRT
jgi:hypothetical protein